LDKTYNNQTAFTLPRPQPTRKRGRASGVPRPANQRPAAPVTAALARGSGKRRAWIGRERGIVANNTATTKNLPSSSDCGSRTLTNGPATADNPGCCCIGLKTGRARTGCEHGSVKMKQAKPATHPLLCHQKNLPTRTQHLAPKPAIHPDKRPPTDVGAAGVRRWAAVCPGGGGGEAPMPKPRARR